MKYIVSYAEYNRNESHDALVSGVIHEVFDTIDDARACIMKCIREEVENELSDGCHEGETVEEVMSGWTLRDEPRSVATEHDGIESVYEVCAFSYWPSRRMAATRTEDE